jgi:hypothetical protein
MSIPYDNFILEIILVHLNIGVTYEGISPMIDDDKNYFKTNYFLKVLRFFNLLEPDRNIISISKTFMWVMLVLLGVVFMTMPDQLDVVLTGSAAMIATMMNYSFRRWVQYQNIKNGHPASDRDDGDSGDSGWRHRRSDQKTNEYDI